MSPTSPASRPRAPAALTIGAVLAAVVVLVVVVSVIVTRGGGDGDPDAARAGTGRAEPSEPTPAAPLSTRIADLDTGALTVQRAGFCDLVAPETLEAALGGPPADVTTYGNGESAAISAEVDDIAHEYGCRWRRGPLTLRAWVFAPPVTSADAGRLVRDARSAEGCDVQRDAPAFGEPSIARTCPAGKGFGASYRGLFGDAWLACSLTARGDRESVLTQADPWCAAVAEAAAAPPA